MSNEQRVRFFVLNGLVAVLLLLTSVGATGASSLSATTPPCDKVFPFARTNFTRPLQVNNNWYPLVPGTQMTLVGSTSQGAHSVVFTVTDLVKLINGVPARVLWDTDFSDGQLVESELAFQAQDKDGNVWVLGEYPEEYEDGEFVGAPNTWITGIAGALGGPLVPGRPKVGTPSYSEGTSPKIDFADCGQVFATGQTTSIPFGSFKNVLVINEWIPLDPTGAVQQKFYAPGVGNVQIGDLDDPEAEVLTLVSLVHLSRSALADARKEALKLDRHGYQVSAVYRRTLPAVWIPLAAH